MNLTTYGLNFTETETETQTTLDVIIKKVDSVSLMKYVNKLGLELDNIPLSKILGMSRVILFE